MAAAAADPSYYNHLALHIRPSQPLQYNPFFRSLFGFIAALFFFFLLQKHRRGIKRQPFSLSFLFLSLACPDGHRP